MHINRQILLGTLAGLLAVQCGAAVFVLEDFSVDEAGWTDRDGYLVVAHDGLLVGNPVGSLSGTYASQFFPVPQADAFTLNTVMDFVTPGYTQLRFDFFAQDTLPSDLFIRLVEGANVFSHQFSLSGFSPGQWFTNTVNLAWSSWIGPDETSFNSMLANVESIQIEFARNGTGEQTFFLDNFVALDDPISETIAVPEPGAMALIFQGLLIVLALRRRGVSRSN